MILKVKTQNECGWMFYDGVSEVQHWVAYMENMEDVACDGRFIGEEKMLHQWGRKGEEKEMVVVCTFKQRGDEKRKMIAWNTIAYLLNDEGKTIERI